MAKKSFRKVLSLFLAVCMIVSMFMCMTAVTVSAATEYMFTVASNYDYFRETYKKDITLESGKTYMFTLDMNFTDSSKLAFPVSVLCTADRVSLNNSTYTTSYNDNGAPTTTGAYRRIITFTMAKDVRYFAVKIGNTSMTGPVTYGRPALYAVNKSGLPYGNSLIDAYDSDHWHNTGADAEFGAFNYWGRRASNAGTTNGRATYDASLFPAAMTFGTEDIQEGYDEGSYSNQGSSKTARFTRGIASYLNYLNDNRLYTEGNSYELGFEINDVAASDVFVSVELDGTAQTLDTPTIADGYYITGFTASKTSANISLKIGTSTGAKELLIAKPYINEFDELQQLGDVNFIHDIAENTVETFGDNAFATENKMWNRVDGSDTFNVQSVRLYNYSSLNPAEGPTTKRITFNGNNYSVLRYQDHYNAGILGGTTYKVTIDYRKFSASDVSISTNLGGTSSKVVDETNKKIYYTFTPDTDYSSFYLDIISDSVAASIGSVNMYALDANSEPTGDSLIDDLNSMTLFVNTSKVNNAWPAFDRCWSTRGVTASNLIYVSDLPYSNYFSANPSTDKAVYFPEGFNNYQVIVYKDPDLRLAVGTYRFIIDKNQILGSSTDNLFYETDLSKSISKQKVAEDDYTVTYEFTLDAAVRGFGTKIGNYGDGVDSAIAYKCPVLKKYENDTLVGPNLIEPMNARTIDIREGGSVANAKTAKWNSANYSSGNMLTVDVDKYFPGAVATTGSDVLLEFPEGRNWVQGIYYDSTLALEKNKTYRFTVNTKEFGANNSTFAFFYSTDLNSNILNNSAFTTNVSDTTVGTVRTIEFTMAKTAVGVGIRLGNYSDNTDVAVVYANPKLIDVNGSDANLIVGMSTDSVDFSKDKQTLDRKWTTRGYSQSGTASNIYKSVLPENYFTAPVAKMVYINEATTGYKIVKTSANLKPSTTYTFEADWRSFAGAIPSFSFSATNTSSSGFANKEATAIDETGYVGLGHYTCTFTTQDDLKTGAVKNFELTLAAVIKDNDYVHYGRGSLYYGNITLKEQGSDRNILFNSDFSMNNEVQVTDANNGSFAPKWEVGISKNNGSRDLYNDIRILAVPAGFFTEAGSTAEGMMQFNGGSNDYIRQSFVLKSNTKYRLTYKFSYVNAVSGNYVQLIDANNAWTSVSASKNTYDYATHLNTYEFTTLSNLRDTYANAVLNFFIGANGSDVKFYFGDVKLYELDGNDAITGPNLVNNGGLNFGTENVTELYDAGAQARHIGTKATIGWDIQGKFENNQSISVVPLTSESFPSYTPVADRLTMIVNMLLDKVTPTPNAYTDLDNSGTVDLIDFVKTKKKAANPSGINVEAQANTWKSNYVTGNNTTDLAALSAVGMLATAHNGTTYYVDATNGNDSNNGTSEATPWKSLSKVNSASISSGSAVLFKCGEVFRPASISNSDSLVTKSGVTYGSYGSGAKPVITGSLKNYKSATWTNESGNIWYTTGMGTSTCNDVGIVVYNYGSQVGDMKLAKADLAKNGDFFYRGPDDTKTSTGGKIYVYCDSNPATKYSSIEIGQNMSICSLANNVTINNICFKYSGKHGIEGSSTTNVAISNCQVSYIGGAYGDTARLGNGIQFGLSATSCKVKNCYVTECFDAGLTFQDWNGGGTFESINFSNNLVENCNYAIEWFGQDKFGDSTNETTFNNIWMTSNILRTAGYGWSYDERVGYETNYDVNNATIGTLQTSLMRVGSNCYHTKLTNMYFQNNILDRSKGGLVYWYWNAKNNDGTFPENVQSGFSASGNSFYQAKTDDDKIVCFWREGFVQGISKAGVLEGLKRFENIDAPTGDYGYYITDERVIEN